MKVTMKIAEFWQRRVKGLLSCDPKNEFVSLLWRLRLPEDAIRRPPGNITSAAGKGDLAAVKEFIADGQSVNEETPGYSSPLDAAATKGQLGMVEFLLQLGLDPGKTRYVQFSPAANAAQAGYIGVVKRLLEAGIPEEHRKAALVKAKARKFDTMAKLLAELPVSTEEYDKALKESLERIQPRFKRKDWPEGNDRASLEMQACELIETPEVRATIRELNDESGTLLDLAIQTGSTEIVQRMLDLQPPKDFATYALLEAARRGEKTMVELLLKSGADPRFKGEVGNTALLEAAGFGDIELVGLLLAAGADARAETLEGETPFTVACGPFRNRIRNLLKKAGK